MTSLADTTKFEPLSLSLDKVWVEAAGHVDYQLSTPGACSYKSELGETWRGLDPVTQRSYILVSVKKAEACMKGKRMYSFTERYMVLLRYVFELLWVNTSSSKSKRAKRPALTSSDPTPLPVPTVSTILPGQALNAETVATILPRSPTWYSMPKEESRSSEGTSIQSRAMGIS